MTPLKTVQTAYKRATRWGTFEFSGPFSVVRSEGKGAGIAASNYGLALDGEEDWFDMAVILSQWAEAINRYCNTRRLDSDESVSLAFACFRSRMFFNPTFLQETGRNQP